VLTWLCQFEYLKRVEADSSSRLRHTDDHLPLAPLQLPQLTETLIVMPSFQFALVGTARRQTKLMALHHTNAMKDDLLIVDRS